MDNINDNDEDLNLLINKLLGRILPKLRLDSCSRILCTGLSDRQVNRFNFLKDQVSKKHVDFIDEFSELSNKKYSYVAIFCFAPFEKLKSRSLLKNLIGHLCEDGAVILVDLDYSNCHHLSDLYNLLNDELDQFFALWNTSSKKHNMEVFPASLETVQAREIAGSFCVLVGKKPPADPMTTIVRKYNNGELEKYEYIRQMHHINRGLASLARRLKATDIRKVEISDDDLLFTTRKDNIKLHFNGVDRRAAPFEILNFGSYEAEEQDLLEGMISGASVILDIGANIGWYTTWFGKHSPESTIYAFEPIPDTFHFLSRNIDENQLKNVSAYNIGIGAKNDCVDFYYFPQGSIVASQANLLNCKKSVRIECKLCTLDRFVCQNNISNIDFIKCDVEGGELDVIKGGATVLSQYHPIIYTELYEGWCKQYGYCSNDILKTLARYGYQCYFPYDNALYEIDDVNLQKNPERMNYFFLHMSKHKKLLSEKVKGKFTQSIGKVH